MITPARSRTALRKPLTLRRLPNLPGSGAAMAAPRPDYVHEARHAYGWMRKRGCG